MPTASAVAAAIAYCAWPGHLSFTPTDLAAFEAHVHENPMLAHQQATGDGGPAKISDLLTRERYHRLALYAEFYRHLQVEHQIAFGLPSADGRIIGMALTAAAATSPRTTATCSRCCAHRWRTP